MRRIVVLLASMAALSGCAAAFGGPPLISGKSPPSPMAASSEPEPANSLPAGAEGVGNSGPNARYPNAASVTIGTAR